jgi:hypothetical protein
MRRAPTLFLLFASVTASVLADACGSSRFETAPPEAIAGTYSGTDSSGGLQWTLLQSTPNGPVTGEGTFLATATSTVVSYTIRGTYAGDALELRLVGAPGDTDADSVWFSGRGATELYAGAAFTGSLYGPNAALFGSLSMYLTTAH